MDGKAKSRVVEGLPVTSTPLTPWRTLDLLPELSGLMEPGAGADSDLEMFAKVVSGMGKGKLRELLPQILAGTKVTVEESGKPTPVPLNSVEMFDLVFDGRMEALPGVVAFALEVSFGGFLAGLARLAEARKKSSP